MGVPPKKENERIKNVITFRLKNEDYNEFCRLKKESGIVKHADFARHLVLPLLGKQERYEEINYSDRIKADNPEQKNSR